MADILECVALLVWIALGLYTFRRTRKQQKRLDGILDKLEDEGRAG